MKKLLRKLVPEPLILAYHYVLALVASAWYRNPSKKMVVIGVTGTKGKTTTANLIAHVLESAGHTVGLSSTVQFKIADKVWINDTKMGMLGRFRLQKMLKEMKQEGVTHVIVETTSEGIKQHRHRGIRYDAAVYTNVSPEHIESHGSYEAYRNCKFRFVSRVALSKVKKINGKPLKKALVCTTDIEDLRELVKLPFDKRWIVDVDVEHNVDLSKLPNARILHPTNIKPTTEGITFDVNDAHVELPILGSFNAYNAVMAMAVGSWLDVPKETLVSALKSAPGIPGRMELIDEGQDFTVVVDYAHEPKSLEAAYKAMRLIADSKTTPDNKPRVITLTGSQGGGRDKSKRPIMGEIAAKLCDFVIVTDEDPYDEPVMDIIEDVAKGVERGGKLLNNNYWKIENRREGIEKALSLAKKDDVVIITGKGAEQIMMGKNNERIPWDEREIVREALRKIRE